MRILHFAESFSQPTETFIKRYVEKSCRFAEVGVVAFNFQNIEEELKTQLSLFEIRNKLYTRKNVKGVTRFVFERLTGQRLWYKELDEAIQAFKPDIIHCHFGNTGVMMTRFKNKFKDRTPYVTSFYGYDISSHPVLDKKYRNDLNNLWKQGNGFFAEGPELAKKIVDLGGPASKCLTNPLLIPMEDYPLKMTYRSVGDPVKFLFIGRFIEKKGLHIFLKVLGQSIDKAREFSIDIVGSGPLEDEYRQIIATYHLEPFVKWHGMVKHPDIIAMMKDYDFLVHPSLTAKDNDSEGGAPTIIIEAQSIGLPVITTNHADIPYVMGYNDFMAKENDIPSLVDAIIKMINCNHIQHYTKSGRDKVLKQHNLEQSDIYQNNLKKILSAN